jgi:transcriptional regulator with XRE-family HTH domain
LRKLVTTSKEGIAIVATMSRKPSRAPLAQIYANRQPRRPHYLPHLMERYGVTRGEIVEALGVDKSQLSRWLDENRPSTPSPEWARKLGEFFGKGHDTVDIFTDPDVDWMSRLLQGRSADEKERIKAMIEAAFPAKRA